jgi:hypothetical protein
MPKLGQRRDPVDRFVEKVEFSDLCWLFTGCTKAQGYGAFYHNGRMIAAHVFAWTAFVGPIPEGRHLDHVKAAGCTNRHCVNPDHLEPVTPHENTLRGESWAALNARKTHCPQGHPYDEKNTYPAPGGGRVCRTCKIARITARRVVRRAERSEAQIIEDRRKDAERQRRHRAAEGAKHNDAPPAERRVA